MDNRITICEEIAKDAANDAKEFDGKPFTGKVVAEYFGNHGASIAALADLVKSILEEQQNKEQGVKVSDTTKPNSTTKS